MMRSQRSYKANRPVKYFEEGKRERLALIPGILLDGNR
jgi:hypothetical protein